MISVVTYLLWPYQMPTKSSDHLVVLINPDGLTAGPMSKADILLRSYILISGKIQMKKLPLLQNYQQDVIRDTRKT